MITQIKNAIIITDQLLEGYSLYMEGGVITAACTHGARQKRSDRGNDFMASGMSMSVFSFFTNEQPDEGNHHKQRHYRKKGTAEQPGYRNG